MTESMSPSAPVSIAVVVSLVSCSLGCIGNLVPFGILGGRLSYFTCSSVSTFKFFEDFVYSLSLIINWFVDVYSLISVRMQVSNELSEY